ncbi:MAG: hypothetical protein HYY55_03195 [Candidatus Niyogibacteria bacterium]|nr:MAG: hypothetical protein HYY55_03195 [Candidatus Niyogibacteria bacterium]
MKEKFVPQFLDPESGEMKPIPPERLAEIKREEKDLEKQERAKTIRLKQGATFAELFDAENRIAEKIEGSEDEEDVGDPTHLVSELWDNFDEDVVLEVLDFKAKLEALSLKKPEEYTEEEKKLANLNVAEYFHNKGYSVEDIETFLPIKFKKKKQT